MPSNDQQPKPEGENVRLIYGTAPRKASPKSSWEWDPTKPPGGKLKLPPKEKTE